MAVRPGALRPVTSRAGVRMDFSALGFGAAPLGNLDQPVSEGGELVL